MCTDACETTAGNSSAERIKKRRENQVCEALEREVRVRTDLVKSDTADPTKQVAGLGPACSGDPAVFTQTIKKNNTVPLPLPGIRTFSPFLSLLSASRRP